jgi:segregation and condensation protein B
VTSGSSPPAHVARSPASPNTYVTIQAFLAHFGLNTLRDLPEMEALKDAGLLSKENLLAGDFPDLGGVPDEVDDQSDDLEVSEPSEGSDPLLR